MQDNDVRGGVRTEDNGAVTVGDLVRDAYAKDSGVAVHAVKMGIETNVMHELCHVLHQVRRRRISRVHFWRRVCAPRATPMTKLRTLSCCMQVVNPDTYWLLTESKVTPIQALTVRRGAGHCEFSPQCCWSSSLPGRSTTMHLSNSCPDDPHPRYCRLQPEGAGRHERVHRRGE
jgi:hypothetical protein